VKRASYQHGSVELKKLKKGPDVWVFRYMDGGRRKSKRLGTALQVRSESAAKKAALKFLDEINNRINCITVDGLIDKYVKEGIPSRHSTSAPYRSNLKRIRAEFGDERVDDIAKDLIRIEQWINDLRTFATKNTSARDASKKTKMNIKNLLHRLFECAIKWGSLPMQRNPIGLVEIKGRRKKVRHPNLITTHQWNGLMSDPDLPEHVRTALCVAMILGLRASEILGLKWEDIGFDSKKVHVRRSVVGKKGKDVAEDTKTEGSEQELPMHEDLEAVLDGWLKSNTAPDGTCTSVNGWLFSNPQTGKPYWRDSLQKDHLVPAGKRLGKTLGDAHIIKNLGWHDFRHTYRAMMRELKLSPEEQKTLMRHEDIRTTMQYGGKVPAEYSRDANAKVVAMLKRKVG